MKFDAETIAVWYVAACFNSPLPLPDSSPSILSVHSFLYYAQGFHLRHSGVTLFDDVMKAWACGPVVPSLKDKYPPQGPRTPLAPEHFPAVFRWDDYRPVNATLYTVWDKYLPVLGEPPAGSSNPWVQGFNSRTMTISVESLRAFPF